MDDKPLEKYIGQKFGDWLVIGIGEIKYYSNGKGKKSKIKTLKCKCECGYCNNIVKDIAFKTIKKGVKNCGTKARKINGHNNKKYNTYGLKDNYIVGYTDKGEEFYIDKEDYEKVYPYCWHKHKDGYFRTIILDNGERTSILMHNLIYQKQDLNNDIDHINGIPFDNRKSNLRECNHCNNMKNTKLRIDNKSGVIGVYLVNKKWKANITVDKKQIHLGTFENIEDAIKIRLQYEKDYFGEFAPQKHLFEQYNIN